ncbi:MAG: biotin carboxylase [Sumerlaeia bacterium]
MTDKKKPATKRASEKLTAPQKAAAKTPPEPTAAAAKAAPTKARRPTAKAPAAKAAAKPADDFNPPAVPVAKKISKRKRKVLKGMSDIRRYFYRNETPYYFISGTNFNLMNMDEWVGNFHYISYIDCFDKGHSKVFSPSEIPHDTFTGIEDINNYLLSHKETIDFVNKRGTKGNRGKAVFLMFDEKTEQIAQDLGLEVCFPPAALRSFVDDKINTTKLAERAGVKCVPNILAKIESYEDLCKKSSKLGNNLVVQTAYGDSGHTTFFINNKRDFAKYAEEITAEDRVKVMKRIRCRGSAQEACVTRHGTIVGPLMTELVGFDELTPYKGGWCGNEVFADSFSKKIRNEARKSTVAFGEELRKIGYRGYFEVDYLMDQDDGKVYLGEVNPRITGASSMTNLAAFAHADAPLMLFHLLEWADEVDFEIDVDALNARWSDPENIDSWSQLVMKHTYDTVDLFTDAPRTGVWGMKDDGTVEFLRPQTHRRTVSAENEAFFLRISKPGDYRYEGCDLGILLTPGRLMTNDHSLTKRAKAWIAGLKAHYRTVPLNETPPEPQPVQIGSFKLL